MIDEQLTRNFHLSEFLSSDMAVRAGIDNTPPAVELGNIRGFLAPGMQRVRDLLGSPVLVSSGYRSPALNAAVRGSKTSQHMHGLAADFTCPGFGSPLQVARALLASAVEFDQLIQEGQWVHISFTARPRRVVLTAVFSAAGVSYRTGLV